MKKYLLCSMLLWSFISASTLDAAESGKPIIRERGAKAATDCSSYEKFNAQRSACYFECHAEQECRGIRQKSAMRNDDIWDKSTTPKLTTNRHHDDQVQDFHAQYIIKPDLSIKLLQGKSQPSHFRIWSQIKEAWPKDIIRQHLEFYRVYQTVNDDFSAFVQQNEADDRWGISVNLTDFDNLEFNEKKLTLLHELGHLVSLNRDQMSAHEEKTCKTYWVDEGCLKVNSYSYLFIQRFWGANKSKQENRQIFFTEYSSSNPLEDFAESFAFFVATTKPIREVVVKDTKLVFFYQFPELVRMREDLIKRLGLNPQQAQSACKDCLNNVIST